jgi:hypothetical protein
VKIAVISPTGGVLVNHIFVAEDYEDLGKRFQDLAVELPLKIKRKLAVDRIETDEKD